MTQVRSYYVTLSRNGTFSVQQEEHMLVIFECLSKSLDNSTIITGLDGKGKFALITGGTSSNATFNTIRIWIAECRSSHSLCLGDAAPRREKLSGIRFLRMDNNCLFLTEDVEPDRYACLSHCWGSAENLIRTTIQNRNDHVKMGVEIVNLPKTYHDALVVCKELGIDYIWIDSLCIVQDDDYDWREQASRMADIYELAYVTIAAVWAEDASQGLFSSTSTSRMGSPLPGFPWIHVRKRISSPSPWRSGYGTTSDDGWALYTRGWTFQELNLSPRVLHFGAEEVFWSCRKMTVSEGAPWRSRSLLAGILVKTSNSHVPLQKRWYEIVGAYSLRNLTFGKDKFPAIAAFASRFQAICPGNRYVAGLWEKTLFFDLLWECFKSSPDPEPPHPIKPGTIPSWSWASAKRPVRWNMSKIEVDTWQRMPCTEVIQVVYNTRGPPILGDIVEASLVLRAPVVELYKDYCKELKTYWKGVKEVSDRVTALLVDHWDDHELDNAARDQSDSPHKTLPPEVLAIPLTAPKPGTEATGSYNALIVTMKSPGIYRRAGVGTLGLLEEFLDGRGIPIEADHIGEGSSDRWERELAQIRAKKKQIREKWEGRFTHEMSRLERRVIKLV